jgi:hypothetical protein
MARRLAAKITQRTDALIADLRRKPVNLPDVVAAAERHVTTLQYDAHLAWLDGREARHSALTREASRLLRYIPPAQRVA